MIEYIHGDLIELTPALAVVETAGGWATDSIYRSIHILPFRANRK